MDKNTFDVYKNTEEFVKELTLDERVAFHNMVDLEKVITLKDFLIDFKNLENDKRAMDFVFYKTSGEGDHVYTYDEVVTYLEEDFKNEYGLNVVLINQSFDGELTNELTYEIIPNLDGVLFNSDIDIWLEDYFAKIENKEINPNDKLGFEGFRDFIKNKIDEYLKEENSYFEELER